MNQEFYIMRCSKMDYLKETQKYYSNWLDVVPSIFLDRSIKYKKTPKRDIKPNGYSKCFHLYCYISNENIIFSYSEKLENEIEQIRKTLKQDISVQKLKEFLNNEMKGAVGHNLKFYFDGVSRDLNSPEAIQLTSNEYNDYLIFFKTLNPNTKTDWLKGYYDSIVDKGYCWGIYKDGKLVSVTDAPDIPYMDDIIVEPGVNTLKKYRNQGYAKIVTDALIKYLLKNDKVPIWSCSYNNKASMALAYSLGYKKLADIMTFTIE